MKGGVFLTQIVSGIGSFLTAIVGDANMLLFVCVLVAVAIAGVAFGLVRRFLRR